MTIEAYPLHYPINHQRTPAGSRKDAQFTTSFARARDTALFNLQKLGAVDIIISTNIPLRRDGLPYASGEKSLQDPGIAVYFKLNKEQKVICCDAFIRVADNMQAVAKSLEALRGLQRWKCSNIINQAFTGFAALPDAGSFWKVFDLDNKPASKEELKKAYNKKIMVVHPDLPTGNRDVYEQLNAAYQMALKTFE